MEELSAWYIGSALAAKTKRRNYLRIAATVAWIVIFAVGLTLGSQKYSKTLSEINPLFWIMVLIINVLPIGLFKPFTILDKLWTGKVVRKLDVDGLNMKFGRFESTKTAPQLDIYIERADGSVVVLSYRYDAAAIADNYYRLGDSVIHFPGTKFLFNVSNSTGDFFCVNCGHMAGPGLCPRCHFPVMDAEMLPAETLSANFSPHTEGDSL